MGIQNETKRDLSVIGIRELDSKDYLTFCLKQAQDREPVWVAPFFAEAVLLKYEIDYYSCFTLNIFIIADRGQKYLFEFFVSLNPEKYYPASNISVNYDRKNEPALVTATYSLHDIWLTSHITNYMTGKINAQYAKIAPVFIGLAGRIVPDNLSPTGVSLYASSDITGDDAAISGFTDRLGRDEYFRTIDSFILPTAILKNLDPVRNKNNFDILAPIKSVEYVKQARSYIVELAFGPVIIPMAIAEDDILNQQPPQAGARFHGVAWSQCRVR